MKNLYVELLNNLKNVSESLACCSLMVGEEYKNSDFKLLVVGRAINGWDNEWESEISVDEYAEKVIEMGKNAFQWTKIITPKRGYDTNESSFWRVTREILKKISRHNDDIWISKIAWSNLYKVAKSSGGNPSDKLCSIQLEVCKKILFKEIKEIKPDLILFITDMNWFEDFNLEEFEIEENNGETVVAYGKYENSKIIVTKRPERKAEDKFVNEVISIFKQNMGAM